MKRVALAVLWPAFLAATLAEGVIFSLVDPVELGQLGGAALSPLAVYSIGFFMFWGMGTLASVLTCYLILVPVGEKAPF